MASALFDLACDDIRRDERLRRKIIQGNEPRGSYKSNFAKDLQAYAIAYEALVETPPAVKSAVPQSFVQWVVSLFLPPEP